jgi:hypothetical protein
MRSTVGSRVDVVRELIWALGRRGDYANTVEELTPLAGDPIAAVTMIAAVLGTIARPQLWRAFKAGTGAANGSGGAALSPGKMCTFEPIAFLSGAIISFRSKLQETQKPRPQATESRLIRT